MVAAVTVREGTTIEAGDLDQALDKLPVSQRPRYVQVINSIPVTTWHRPQWRPLQAKGVPKPGRGRRVWRLGSDRAHYEELS
jgi:putative long chain acyl-CoA synthase